MEQNPETNKKWEDRHGIVFGKKMKKAGNVERYLSYKKLQRTGKLLRGIKVRRERIGDSTNIILYNNVPYASDHEEGSSGTEHKRLGEEYVKNGATGAVLGGNVTPRPHMKPSANVLNTPIRVIDEKLKELGW